jgi:transposase
MPKGEHFTCPVFRWPKAFLEAGKNGLTVDARRDATKGEVQGLREENEALKKALAESVLDVQRLKKSLGM